ncbi:hypothetical protein PIB30_006135 [Stylosanthes scabra]|uniref:Uncharacterized protein n=1 Tax=Stylosanthes scabra TaxID=79078 RepID=A0ABU6X1G5_9FABA|nr:hypothetical protein [Stylosanthes scabra]
MAYGQSFIKILLIAITLSSISLAHAHYGPRKPRPIGALQRPKVYYYQPNMMYYGQNYVPVSPIPLFVLPDRLVKLLIPYRRKPGSEFVEEERMGPTISKANYDYGPIPRARGFRTKLNNQYILLDQRNNLV